MEEAGEVSVDFVASTNETVENIENNRYFPIFQYDFTQELNSVCSTKKQFNSSVFVSLKQIKLFEKLEDMYIPNASEDNFFKNAKW